MSRSTCTKSLELVLISSFDICMINIYLTDPFNVHKVKNVAKVIRATILNEAHAHCPNQTKVHTNLSQIIHKSSDMKSILDRRSRSFVVDIRKTRLN